MILVNLVLNQVDVVLGKKRVFLLEFLSFLLGLGEKGGLVANVLVGMGRDGDLGDSQEGICFPLEFQHVHLSQRKLNSNLLKFLQSFDQH